VGVAVGVLHVDGPRGFAVGGCRSLDPANITEALAMSNNTLSSGMNFYFYARLQDTNQTREAGIQSGGYVVTGYARIGAAGPRLAVPSSITILLGIFLITILNV
jgi:hypothetical protein